MQGKDLLLDLLDDNTRRVRQLLEEITDGCLHWQPDLDANSIAVTLWHASRAFDVFMMQHIKGQSNEKEIWIQSGWANKSGYDPRGVGTNGWGMLTGYSPDEMRRIPRFEKEILRGYYNEMVAIIQSYLEKTNEEELSQTAPGLEGRRTKFYWVRHPLFDLTRHVGEILALKAMWERQNP
jgi:DinB superfamily